MEINELNNSETYSGNILEELNQHNNELMSYNQQNFEFFNQEGLSNGNVAKSVYQCVSEDEVRNKEITKALNKIEIGEQFAFYDIGLSKKEKQILTDIEITEYNEIKINSSADKLKQLSQEVSYALMRMDGVSILELEGLSELVTRVVSIIVGELKVEEFELKIRTRESYQSEEDCMYWHLDKSEREILGNCDNGEEKRFIMILKGEGTAYQKISEKQRETFMKVAEEAPYYYGHGLDGCKTHDEINHLFRNQEKVFTKEQYGSVHIAGSNGAMHAAPKESESRLILLLTPKNNSTK